MARASWAPDLVPGTLEMLILQTLTIRPMHGYAVAKHIADCSRDVVQVGQGSLYPALERLLSQGFVTANCGGAATGLKAGDSTITASCRRRLGQEISEFDNVLAAIARVLQRA